VSLNQHYRTVKVKRTATVKGTDSPNFSECFNFRIPAAQVDVTSVCLQVLQAVSGYGRGKFCIYIADLSISLLKQQWSLYAPASLNLKALLFAGIVYEYFLYVLIKPFKIS
jgi:hypothetical protein